MQRTPEWFQERKDRITGSVMGAVLGLSPWQKPQDVLRAMVRDHHGYPSEFKSNPAVDHGVYHETQALLAFMRKTGLQVQECGFFPYGDALGASPDGITSDDAVLEIKVPFGLRNEKEAKFKTLAEQPHYYVQVQMEMISAEKTKAYFVQYIPPKGDPFLEHSHIPEQISIEVVELDPNWLDDNLPAISAFYNLYKSELTNSEHLESLRVENRNQEIEKLAARYADLSQEIKLMQDDQKSMLAKLVVGCEEKNTDFEIGKLTKVSRKGSVDYAKLLEEHAPTVDIETYRKEDSTFWRFSVSKK